jgi:hypothetical protein
MFYKLLSVVSLFSMLFESMAFSVPFKNVLILDHLNINHEQHRHDQLKAFYFSFLQCAIDPHKKENLEKSRKTLWANIGAQQFHLPEGKPDAQILKGQITLGYPDIRKLLESYERDKDTQNILNDSKFNIVLLNEETLEVSDPWGNKFMIVNTDRDKDDRGTQAGNSLGIEMSDLLIQVPINSNMSGIARFYEQILDTPILECNDDTVIVSMGPYQTLTFAKSDNPNDGINMHVDLRDEPENNPEGKPYFLSNYGPHISIYVADIRGTYKRADALGSVYVNPRFSRKAYDENEVVSDCMFRCLDIIDPLDVESGPIIRLEHEVRSVVKADGSLYKSCPFVVVPKGCIV